MKVRFYKVTVIVNGIETVLYIPASGKNNLTRILKAFELSTVKIEFLGWRGLGSNGTANRLSEKFHSAFLSFTARLMVLRLQPTVF